MKIEDGDEVLCSNGFQGILIGTVFDLNATEIAVLQSKDRVQIYLGSIKGAVIIRKSMMIVRSPQKVITLAKGGEN